MNPFFYIEDDEIGELQTDVPISSNETPQAISKLIATPPKLASEQANKKLEESIEA